MESETLFLLRPIWCPYANVSASHAVSEKKKKVYSLLNKCKEKK